MDLVKGPIIINKEEVKSVLSWPIVASAVEEALKATCNGPNAESLPFANQPARSFTFTDRNDAVLLTMPGFVGNYNLYNQTFNTLACKVVTSFGSNVIREPPLPKILANILLFDHCTGELTCVMDGTEITGWRTAAASIVATKYIFLKRHVREKNTNVILSIIGCGVQGRMHAIGFCNSFENIVEIRLWNKTSLKANSLLKELEFLKSNFPNQGIKIRLASTVEECVRDADIIVTATSTTSPLVHCDMVKSNVHINAVGAGDIHHSELSEELYAKSNVYIDHWAGAKTELKDLKANIICEVGELINSGREVENGITIFQSLGMASEDATVAQAVYEALKGKC